MTPQFLRTEPGADPVIVEGQFDATPERVFRAWTDPADIKRWFGRMPPLVETAEIDLRVGGGWRFQFGENDGKRSTLCGEYRRIEPPALLEFRWAHEMAFADGRSETSPSSKVTVTFSTAETGTMLRLVHESLGQSETRVGVGAGWDASFTRLATTLGSD